MTRAKDISKIITAPVFGGLTYPTTDGSANQFMKTDGSGNLSFATVDFTALSATNLTSGTVPSARVSGAYTGITGVGTLTTLTVDDITINGSTISDGGDLTIDVAGDIILDADGADVSFRDDGTGHLSISNSSNDAVITSLQNDKDMIFKGVDGGGVITALTLDMSAAGDAFFNSRIYVPVSIVHTGDSNTSIDFDTDIIDLYTGGSLGLRVSNSTVTVNEGGADKDFRVETDNHTHTFFIEGSTNNVGIMNSNSPTLTAGKLNVELAGVAITGDTDGVTMGDASTINLFNNNSGVTNSTIMLLGTTSVGVKAQIASGIGFTRENSNNWGTQLRFYTHETNTTDVDALRERMRILSGGEVAIGGTGFSGQPFSLQTSSVNLGYMQTTSTTRGVMNFRDANSTGNVGFGAIGNNHVFMRDSTERMRLDTNGNLLVGRTDNPSGVSNGVYVTGAYAQTTSSIANMFINSEGRMMRSTGVLPFQQTPVEASTASTISVGTGYTTIASVAIQHDANDKVLFFASFQVDTQSSSSSGHGDFRILATNTSQSVNLNTNAILAESARLRFTQAYMGRDARGISAITTYHLQIRKFTGSMNVNANSGTSRLLLIKQDV